MDFALALHSPSPVTVALRIEPGRYCSRTGRQAPRPGFGLGTVSGEFVHVERHLFDGRTEPFADEFRCDALVVQTAAERPAPAQEDLAPHRFFSWLATCTGAWEPAPPVRRALQDRVLPFVATQRRGRLASEDLFGCFVTALQEQDGAQEGELNAALLSAGMNRALRAAADVQEAAAPPVNFVVTNGPLLAAWRAGAPLCYTTRNGVPPGTRFRFPGTGVELSLREGVPGRLALLATDVAPPDGRWTALAPGEVLVLHPDGGDEVHRA